MNKMVKYGSLGKNTLNGTSLGDWPPARPDGPEPGSYDMPPEPGPLNVMGDFLPGISNMEKTALVIGGVGLAAWWFLFRGKRSWGRALARRAVGSGRRGRRNRR